MKKILKTGDKVRFLHGHSFENGVVLRVNNKSVIISVVGWRVPTISVKPHKVCSIDDLITLVYYQKIGVEGKFEIEYEREPKKRAADVKLTDYITIL
jgi:hypothetical protein